MYVKDHDAADDKRAPPQGSIRRARRTGHPRRGRSSSGSGMVVPCDDAKFGNGGGGGGGGGFGGNPKNSSSSVIDLFFCAHERQPTTTWCCRWRLSLRLIMWWTLVSALAAFFVLQRQISLRAPSASGLRPRGLDSSGRRGASPGAGAGRRKERGAPVAFPNAERSAFTGTVMTGEERSALHHNQVLLVLLLYR